MPQARRSRRKLQWMPFTVSSWERGDDASCAAASRPSSTVTSDGAGEWHAFCAQLLEHTEDAIIGMDASWVLTLWGKGAERLYGWTSDEVLGRHVTEVARLDLSDGERA